MNNNDIWDIKKDDDEIIDRKKFKINQIKLEHFYFNSGEKDAGMPISTSLELSCYYNYDVQSLLWKKNIVHNYVSLEDGLSVSTDSYEEEINASELIKELEKYDLRELKNNYFSDSDLEQFTHWEITYNNYFKIVGTYDNEIEEFIRISEIIKFKDIMDLEVKKVQVKVENMQNM